MPRGSSRSRRGSVQGPSTRSSDTAPKLSPAKALEPVTENQPALYRSMVVISKLLLSIMSVLGFSVILIWAFWMVNGCQRSPLDMTPLRALWKGKSTIPWTVDEDPMLAKSRPEWIREMPVGMKVLFDLQLWLLYGAIHTALAQFSIQDRLEQRFGIPERAYRSLFAFSSGCDLFFLMYFWIPLDYTIFDMKLSHALGMTESFDYALNLGLVLLLGAGVVYTMIIHGIGQFAGIIDLFGKPEQASFELKREAEHPEVYESTRQQRQRRLFTTGLYGIVRHPMYLFMFCKILLTNKLTADRLLVAAAAFAYLYMFGLDFEEEKLILEFGEPYREYQRQVPSLLPVPHFVHRWYTSLSLRAPMSQMMQEKQTHSPREETRQELGEESKKAS